MPFSLTKTIHSWVPPLMETPMSPSDIIGDHRRRGQQLEQDQSSGPLRAFPGSLRPWNEAELHIQMIGAWKQQITCSEKTCICIHVYIYIYKYIYICYTWENSTVTPKRHWLTIIECQWQAMCCRPTCWGHIDTESMAEVETKHTYTNLYHLIPS